jgi:hypothetical protein
MRTLFKWLGCAVVCSSTSFAGLTLYMGAGGANLIGIVQTNGASAGPVTIINTSYPVNGLAAASGFLFAGDPTSATLRTITPAGALSSSVTGNFPTGCCGESMYYDGTNLWHVHYATEIEKLNPATGTVIATYAQTGKVGITPVNGVLWLSDWDTGDVGPWNPVTNTFTPAFNTGAESFPAGLAFDPAANVLCFGNGSNDGVVPYNLTGTALNGGFVPFNGQGDEIDGMTVYASSGVPRFRRL